MSEFINIYGTVTLNGDYPFGFNVTERMLPIMRRLGITDAENATVWERTPSEVFEALGKVEEDWENYDFPYWTLRYTNGFEYEEKYDFSERDTLHHIPLAPLAPAGFENALGFNIAYRGDFVLDFNTNIRGLDDSHIPYVRFWFETLAGICDCRVLVKSYFNEKDIIDIEYPTDEQRAEWIERYFKFYQEWRAEYEEYRKRYGEVVKMFRNNPDEDAKQKMLREVRSTMPHWQTFVLNKLAEKK